ncbi:UNVERIFIED_CONTAM: hypothetical protein Sradi_7007400 [Sesamum radiatum]|uniref:Uncharacterized protein n=1 Tax=Sesamum radiatum TaxID=300843 RepID=A0AAW2JCP1_SESRA
MNLNDLDHLLGEAEVEVRDGPGQMKSGSVAEKALEHPQALLKDAASPSKESPAQEDDAQVGEKTPSVGMGMRQFTFRALNIFAFLGLL